jgi:hypothetical protein
MIDELTTAQQRANEADDIAERGIVLASLTPFVTLLSEVDDDRHAVLSSARMLHASAELIAGNEAHFVELVRSCGPVSRTLMALQAFDLAQNHSDLDVVRDLAAELVRVGNHGSYELPAILVPGAVIDDDPHAWHAVELEELPPGYTRLLRTVAAQMLLSRPEGVGRISSLIHIVLAEPTEDEKLHAVTIEAVLRLAALCFWLGAPEGQDRDATVRMLRSEADGWTLRTLQF